MSHYSSSILVGALAYLATLASFFSMGESPIALARLVVMLSDRLLKITNSGMLEV
jgi:hypothetical protein